jgi:threonine/homoserine/homoserine lactone efflux protein
MMVLLIIVKGILTGLLLSVYLGPTFFTVMETLLRRGAREAIVLNSGVWLSDISCIIVAYFGAARLMEPIRDNLIFKMVAGGAFLFFGLTYLLRKPDETVKPLGSVGILILLVKGFLINSLNPGVLIFWFGAMIVAVSGLELHGIQILYYFTSTIFTLITFDLLKILFSHKLRKVVTESVMTKLFRITGIILIGLGIFVIIRAFWH